MPTDNKQSPTTNVQTVTPVADDMPPVVMEDTTPPMLTNNDQPTVISDQTSPTTSHESLDTNTGSAAPSNDVVMAPVVTTQKKKFAGGRVIATILGLFLLVGGLGAGIMLVGQNQDVREQAYDCVQDCIDGGGGRLVCGCECGETNSRCPAGDGNTDPATNGTNAGSQDNAGDCSTGGGNWCDGVVDTSGNSVPGFCASPGKTCGRAAADLGYTINLGQGSPGPYTGGWICKIGVNNYTGGPCVQSNSVPNSQQYSSVPNCFCGTIQIDGGPNDGTYTSSCGCNEETPPENNPTPTPPTITAQCQNIKAYSTNNWTLLTPAVLSTLKTGDSVNFCVAGSATGGSFNKAKFTINGVVQAETTTVRPSSTDFCQTYVIPAGTTSFNVTAQINHVTLGWK